MTDTINTEALAAEAMTEAMIRSFAEVKMDDAKYDVLMGREFNRFDANAELTIEQFKNGVLKGEIAYECLFGEIIPIYDYDEAVTDGRDLQTAEKEAFDKEIAALREVWGPDAEILSLTSTGIKKSLDPSKYSGPFISHRHVLPGVGKFASGAHLKLSGRVPAMFDQGVYKGVGLRQLMRVWGGSKEGEDRQMKLILHGKPKTLKEMNDEDPLAATLLFKRLLAQNVDVQSLIEVKMPEATVSRAVVDGAHKVVGKNGEPLGEDIKIDSITQIRRLYEIAGKFGEVNRSYDVYRDMVFGVANICMDCGLNIEEGRALAQELSAVCPNNNPRNVDKLFNKSLWRGVDQTRRNLGHLRDEASKRNEGAYLLWVEQNKREKIFEKKGDEKREPYLFSDHNAFVGKKIEQKTADQWMQDAVIMVINGGESYFLTRDKKTCEISNKQFETWRHAKTEKMMQCLDVDVRIKNPKYDPAIGEIYERKVKLKLDITEDEHMCGREFNYTTFGKGGPMNPGFVDTQIYKRKLNWVREEDFIPYLERRIPNADIARAVKDKTVFNRFRGFPIEQMPRGRKEGRQFVGSAWHRHLVQDICHGDLNEWRHLEASIADMIQRPYRVSNVAHVFQSNQGTGKLFLSKFMTFLLGAPHVMTVMDMNIYMQKFNEEQSTAILKIFEEVRGKGEQFVNNDRLKADITKDTVRVEIKGGAVLNLRHCARYWFLTNHRDTLHIEADDRRYVYHSISNEHANNWDYFEPIAEELKDWEYLRECFEYFAELPYDEKFAMNAINTEYKDEQKLDSMTLAQKFIREFMDDNMIERIGVMDKEGDRVSSEILYDQYKMWCDVNTHAKASNIVFFKQLLDIGIGPKKNMRINGAVKKGIDLSRDLVLNGFRTRFKMPNFNWRADTV